MIDTWKTGTDFDKMEQLIKYKMHKQYHKSVILKKASSNVKQFTVFLWLGAFKTHPDVIGKFTWIEKRCITSSNKVWQTPWRYYLVFAFRFYSRRVVTCDQWSRTWSQGRGQWFHVFANTEASNRKVGT